MTRFSKVPRTTSRAPARYAPTSASLTPVISMSTTSGGSVQSVASGVSPYIQALTGPDDTSTSLDQELSASLDVAEAQAPNSNQSGGPGAGTLSPPSGSASGRASGSPGGTPDYILWLAAAASILAIIFYARKL